jgi:hypothetical protein
MNNYNDFIKLLKEGLIRNHDMRRYDSTLSINLDSIGLKHKIVVKNKFVYEVYINDTNKEKIDILLDYSKNIYGYFPSYFYITLNNNLSNSFIYDDELFEKEISKKNIKEIKIRFEAKYDDGLYKNDNIIPDFLYHLTPDDNVQKIKEIGLKPTSKNRQTYHPERIYLFTDINNHQNILKSLKINDLKNNIQRTYSLLELNMKNNDDIILHTDPNYIIGFFTYDNISPFEITILKKNL